jgi:transposase
MTDTTIWTIGLDLGDKMTTFCLLSPEGAVTETGQLATTPLAFQNRFSNRERMRIALEVGTHSNWLSRLLDKMGHEVLVANASKLALISKNTRKNDRNDAELLARLARFEPELLSPLKHRSQQAQMGRSIVKMRKSLVESRTKLINSIRGTMKSLGYRIPSCPAESFHKKTWPIPDAIRSEIKLMMDIISSLSVSIKTLEKKIDQLIAVQHPEAQRLLEIKGVGPVTALFFVLTIETPERFAKSRDVGPYLGLVPRQDQSGAVDKALRISKTGDKYLRTLLVQCAQHILRKTSPNCVLKQKGKVLSAGGGRVAKRRAVIAVARKLAVVMHRIWSQKETYDPLFGLDSREAALD